MHRVAGGGMAYLLPKVPAAETSWSSYFCIKNMNILIVWRNLDVYFLLIRWRSFGVAGNDAEVARCFSCFLAFGLWAFSALIIVVPTSRLQFFSMFSCATIRKYLWAAST